MSYTVSSGTLNLTQLNSTQLGQTLQSEHYDLMAMLLLSESEICLKDVDYVA